MPVIEGVFATSGEQADQVMTRNPSRKNALLRSLRMFIPQLKIFASIRSGVGHGAQGPQIFAQTFVD
jgi:hypothetical protein